MLLIQLLKTLVQCGFHLLTTVLNDLLLCDETFDGILATPIDTNVT